MILYAIVARSNDATILVESTSPGVEGNHPQVTQQLVKSLIHNSSLIAKGNRKTFAHVGKNKNNDDEDEVYWGVNDEASDTLENFFHVQRGENVYFVCLSDDKKTDSQRANYGFLLNLQKEFTSKYSPSKIEKANAYQFDKAFQKKLSSLMHDCNTNRHTIANDSQASQLNAEVESIKKTIDVNLDLLMKRGVRMESLMIASDDLMEQTQVFHKRSSNLKRVMRKKALYYKLVLAGFALLTIYLMMVKLCGFDLTCEAENSYSDNNKNYYNNDDGNNGGNDQGGGRF